MSKKIRLAIHLKLWQKGELITTTTSRLKSRVRLAVQRGTWDNAFLRVTYPGKERYINDGFYENNKDLDQALSAFTEQSLIKELQ